MAEHIAHRLRPAERRRKTRRPLTADEIAATLVPRRDRFVHRLPLELSVARGLTTDQAELVVDEAMDFLVTQYTVPVHDDAELERAFWAAAAIRARRIHDGRSATVRAGWTRVDLEDHELASPEAGPEAAAVEQSEMEALLEFAATLTQLEREVLSYRFGVVGRPPGAVVISRELGLTIGQVRSAELSLHQKLQRFIAIMAAGNLCRHREPLVAKLVLGGLNAESERLARLHLAHCSACRLEHAARLHDLKSGRLPSDVASILPVLPAAEATRQHRAFWDTLVDWAGRPFSHDAIVNASQVGAAGRGLGGLATVKLATLCIGGASLVGGSLYCVTATDILRGPPNRPAAPRPERDQASKPRGPKEDVSYLRTPAAVTPTPTPRRRATVARATPTPSPTVFAANHESAGAISSAPAGSAPNGGSEFGPGPATGATAPAAPASGGGTEFP